MSQDQKEALLNGAQHQDDHIGSHGSSYLGDHREAKALSNHNLLKEGNNSDDSHSNHAEQRISGQLNKVDHLDHDLVTKSIVPGIENSEPHFENGNHIQHIRNVVEQSPFVSVEERKETKNTKIDSDDELKRPLLLSDNLNAAYQPPMTEVQPFNNNSLQHVTARTTIGEGYKQSDPIDEEPNNSGKVIPSSDEEPKEDRPAAAQLVDIESSQGRPVNPTRKLMKYMGEEKWTFIWATVGLVGGNMGQLVIPYYVGLFTDAISEKNYNYVYTLAWQLGIIVLASSIFTFIRAMLYNLISEKIAKKLRGDLYSSLINKDVEFYDSKKTGDLLSRLGSDTAVIQEGLSTNVSMFIRSFLFIIVAFVFLFIISWELTLLMVASILPVMVFSVVYGKFMKRAQKAVQDSKAQISNVAEETFSNVRTVKAFATESDEARRFNEGNQGVYEIGYQKAVWYGAFNFVANFFVFGSMAAILIVGARLCEQGKLTVGEITAFLFYMMQILLNFMILASVLGSVMSIIGASHKVVELLDYQPKINTTGGIIPTEVNPKVEVKGEIILENVRFNYPTKKDVEVLKGITIAIQKNKVIALVGPSGCGKSSIIQMIERFYDPISGRVTFDGIDVKELDPKWYHSQIAIVSQEPVLFSGTIKENIAYGLDPGTVTQEMLDEACTQANAYGFIHDKDLFPEGYSTVVGERGVKLSGGQKQRIAIARALIRKPKVLLLDEATSALDAESEHQVQRALDKLIKSGEQTVVVIAHRLSTVRDADEIIVIKKGEIAERGTHDELLKHGNGVYKNLVERQLMNAQISEMDKELTTK